MLSRLLDAHEMFLSDTHDAAARVAVLGDNDTNDLLVSDIIRTGALQVWFLTAHLVDTPLIRAWGRRCIPSPSSWCTSQPRRGPCPCWE